MSIRLTKKVKIIIGICAFALIMAMICWIVALALLDTDIKTEVYTAEFDYVDDVMFDNAYIAMRGGKWQLYRGGDAISRSFGYLEYAGDGLFSFINVDGKGWGYVNTSGSVEAEFNQNFKPLLPSGSTNVAVKTDENEFGFKTLDGMQYKGKGEFLPYDKFTAFYDAYGDSYVAFRDENGRMKAVSTRNGEEFSLPFSTGDVLHAASGYLTVGAGENAVTYDGKFQQVNYLKGILPATSVTAPGEYYCVVDGVAVVYSRQGEEGAYSTQIRFHGISATMSGFPFVEATNGTDAIIVSDADVFYFHGGELIPVTDYRVIALDGGSLTVFKKAADTKFTALDEKFNAISMTDVTECTLYRTKEKNRATYTVPLTYLLSDGVLYGMEDGKMHAYLEDVVSVDSNKENTQSRIVCAADGEIKIFDAFFKQQHRLTLDGETATVYDAFLPVYIVEGENGKQVVMPRGDFALKAEQTLELIRCTDENNFFAMAVHADGTRDLYGKNGSFIDTFTLKENERLAASQTQVFAYSEKGFNFISKKKTIDVVSERLYFSGNGKFAVAVKGNKLTVINCNDGAISDERFVAGGITVTETGENTFAFRDTKTGLYGIIDNGKLTLSPTFAQLKLHNGFAIVSVDGAGTSGATYCQIDYNGKRLSKIYYTIASVEGLTMGTGFDLTTEIMNGRGRVILKNVTDVPMNGSGGFDFMNCMVFDEETGRTVQAVRRDNSRLLVVTAGGCKRVISISNDSW